MIQYLDRMSRLYGLGMALRREEVIVEKPDNFDTIILGVESCFLFTTHNSSPCSTIPSPKHINILSGDLIL